MKHLMSLLLVCLLLCGCGANSLLPNPSAEAPEGSSAAFASEEAHASGTMDVRTQGAVLAFSPDLSDVYGLRSFGDNLLLFSGTNCTTLTLLAREDLQVIASAQLQDRLSQQDPSLRIWDRELSYFKESSRETVVLDSSLREVSHIAAPAGLTGKPILSDDRNTLYYCTNSAVRAWDLERDIRRTLKEMAYTTQDLAGLHLNGTVLQCSITDGQQQRTLFLSTENGQLLAQQDGTITMSSWENRYYAQFPTGFSQTLLCGEADNTPCSLIPQDPGAACAFLENTHSAVTASTSANGKIRLEVYDLASGLRTAALTLKGSQAPISIFQSGDWIWILASDSEHSSPVLYRWDPRHTALEDSESYLHTYYTAQSPDLEGLAFCQRYAEEIAEKHGIRIQIWKDPLASQPWDYDFEAEYRVSVLEEELLALDQRLSQYAPGMLEQTASHFSSLTICLVRSIRGSAESGSLEAATGVQYRNGTDVYVAIAVGEFSERTLYHELFHVMETHILDESIAFDQWNALNPAGFQYDYDYAANAIRDSGVYLHPENRAFIDTYSMSFPKEDRARILEYAMLPGNRELFQSKTLQRKLQSVCDGIREAYGLEKAEETFLWEQYLDQ